jgi:glycosyltransferase involved in cell wall biosynthesis
MRVGLNLVYLVERAAGAGRYAYELLPALLETEPGIHVSAFVSRDAPPDLRRQSWAEEVDWVELPVRFSNRTHLLGQVAALPVIAARRRLDVVHSLANGGPPLTFRAAKVVTLLDLIWLHQGEAWDSARAVRSMALFVRLSARAADRLITISEAARDDLVTTLGLKADKIDVAPLGVRPPDGASAVNTRELRRKLELDEAPVVLCVAQKRPYKNLAALIRALPGLEDERAVLILPGSPTEHESELRGLALELGVSHRVRFLDWVSEDELEGLYRIAACVALPSLVEGFGLPVLEAMARGVPVACSNRPSLPEVAGDAALLFDPLDQQGVTEAIRRLLRDDTLRAEMADRGRERARLFSWRKTAEKTLATYRRAIGE